MYRRFLIVLLSVWLVPFCSADVLSEADKQSVIVAVSEHLKSDYVDEDVGRSAARQLEAAWRSDAFKVFEEGEAFAEALSQSIQSWTGDGHLNVEYSKTPLDLDEETDVAFEASEIERYYGAHLNYGVQTASRVHDNIGLLDLRVFAPVEMGGETVTAALTTLAHTDALIIDLRKNGGGMGDMADLVASYLFGPDRQPLTGTYDRPSDKLAQRFTQPFVSGARFGPDKPVYVLISGRTFSAAEALAYNLQALDRATIVGEPSGGGAHPFDYLPIHEHFVLWSVTAKSVNPITGKNWQGVGVQPDIHVNADQALEIAITHVQEILDGEVPL